MPAGFPQFDRTMHSSYEWLDRVAARLDGERRDAYHALHAVLGALRDRLPVDVAVNLSAQMPLLVRGIFFDGYEPAHKPLRLRTADDFVAEVQKSLAAAPRIDARLAIDAVLDALTQHVDRGVFEKIDHMLPSELRAYLALPERGAAPPRKDTAVTAGA